MQEVGGSIPPGSTNNSGYLAKGRPGNQYRTTSPSSRGLGHTPFTDATGVRIPVGPPLQATTPGQACIVVSGVGSHGDEIPAGVRLQPRSGCEHRREAT